MADYISSVKIDGTDVSIKDKETSDKLNNHINANNPHNITKSTIGLGNVDNTKDSEKSVLHAKTADSLTGGSSGITLDQVYPVGSIYMSTKSTSPATLFGGSWSQIYGRFLLSAGRGYRAGEIGGEAEHTLTTAEMPAHTHGAHFYQAKTEVPSGNYGLTPGGGFGGRPLVYRDNEDKNYPYIFVEGNDLPHNNMPPYLVVYMWKRTA